MTVIIPPGSWAAGIVGFFMGAWGKLAAIALLIGLSLLGFRWWLNKHDDATAAEARNKTAVEINASYNKGIAAELQKIHVEVKASKVDLAPLYKKVDQQEAAVATIFGEIHRIRIAQQQREIVYVEKAGAVPPSRLDTVLREVSDSIEREHPSLGPVYAPGEPPDR